MSVPDSPGGHQDGTVLDGHRRGTVTGVKANSNSLGAGGMEHPAAQMEQIPGGPALSLNRGAALADGDGQAIRDARSEGVDPDDRGAIGLRERLVWYQRGLLPLAPCASAASRFESC